MGDDHDDDRRFNIPHGHRYDFNSSIMIAAICSLAFVIVLVLILHIYARCVLRRHGRGRGAVRDLGLTIAHARSAERPKPGLHPSVIASLPVFEFKRINGQEEGSATECSVCLSALEDGNRARELPNCKHTFHADCIDKWFEQNTTCPICRTEAEPRPVPEPREGPVGVEPTAPPLERTTSALSCPVEPSAKVGGSSSSRLSSFRRMLSRERSSRRTQCGRDDVAEDLERQ